MVDNHTDMVRDIHIDSVVHNYIHNIVVADKMDSVAVVDSMVDRLWVHTSLTTSIDKMSQPMVDLLDIELKGVHILTQKYNRHYEISIQNRIICYKIQQTKHVALPFFGGTSVLSLTHLVVLLSSKVGGS